MTMRYSTVESPVGQLLLAARDDGALVRVEFLGETPGLDPSWLRDDSALAEVARELAEYFAGDRRRFTTRLAPEGTGFQLAVWEALREIPYGATATYGEIAARIGRPAASRAVGAANGANPLAIVVPCHRVIGANGTLTGYGGGLDRKRLLLDLEAGVGGCADRAQPWPERPGAEGAESGKSVHGANPAFTYPRTS